IEMDAACLDAGKTGDEVSRLNTDTAVLQMVAANNLPMALRHVLTLVGGVAMLFVVSASLTALVMLVVPVVVVPVVYFGRQVRRRARDAQSCVGDIAAYGHETLSGAQTIQSFNYEDHSTARFAALAGRAFDK